MLVEIENGCFSWNLTADTDPTGFWDRFLDGMLDQPEDLVCNRQLRKAQAKAWIRERKRNIRDGLI